MSDETRMMPRMRATIVAVPCEGWPKTYHHDVATAGDLEAAVQAYRASHPDRETQHAVLLFGLRPPIVLVPGRGSRELQALYADLPRERAADVNLLRDIFPAPGVTRG